MRQSLSDITREPDWLPHRLDLQARRLELVKLAPGALIQPGFLADYKPASDADYTVIGLDELRGLDIETGPLHFIFHTAFCRSTLLARAMNIEGVSIGLSEPAIFASLAEAGQGATPYIAPIMALLARRRADNAAVFVKPTNHSNRLIPELLAACPSATAVLMTNALVPFLESVLRKGMMGRRWGRNLFLELQSYAGMDFGMDSRELFLATDMQVAGLAWFLNQVYFAKLASGPDKARLRVLDGG